MRFRELAIPGAYLILPDRLEDDRGYFARTWCRKEAEAHGVDVEWVQTNVSFNRRRGTLRGLHFQVPPYQEIKLVRCVRGAIFDVIVDLRRDRPTFGRAVARELAGEAHEAVFVPGGCAHGFQTLADDTEVFYQMSQYYRPEAARGIRWNDPELGIDWPPCPHRIMSQRDENLPSLAQCTEF
jgi:dTDP-4-dehydrorhamnose 3,5-epimerase